MYVCLVVRDKGSLQPVRRHRWQSLNHNHLQLSLFGDLPKSSCYVHLGQRLVVPVHYLQTATDTELGNDNPP